MIDTTEKTKIYFCSDVHIEFNVDVFDYFKKNGDEDAVLIVAGDVSNDIKKTTRFLNEISKHYAVVMFVDGNHEHYNRKEFEDNILYLMENKNRNVVYIPDEPIYWEDEKTYIIGVNGWYDFGGDDLFIYKHGIIMNWKMRYNDSRLLNCNEIDIENFAIGSVNYLVDVLQEKSSKEVDSLIIVTHTVPSLKLFDGTKYMNDINNALFTNTRMKKVFSATNERFGENVKKTWIFGHTHEKIDAEMYGIRFVSNPFGYGFENNGHFELKKLEY